MQRWNDLDAIPADLGPTVATLGNFDGVHRGHQAVLAAVVEQARARGVEAVAVTFDPHPIAVLRPELAPSAVTTTDLKCALMARTGIDGVLVQEFTRDLAALTPEEYVQRVFVDALHAVAVVVGRDTRFGVRNSGDVDTLRRLGERHGFTVTALDDVGERGHRDRWSSTLVRERLLTGDVSGARGILGRDHLVSGTVVHGDHRGRELGYPTANLCQDPGGMIPADGVYAGWLERLDLPADDPDRLLPAAVSIGTNPTFDGSQRRVESYVLDRTDLDLYGERVAVRFHERLRETLRFESIDELLVQMADDVARCRAVLAQARRD